jgi:DNA polymerase III delta prime subunit
MANGENYLWSEAYRPHKIDDTVLPPRMKEYFQRLVDKGQIENMTLVGGPGTGKTTVARAMCEEMGIDYILINASENGNIDMLRTTVRQFASTVSFTDGIKCIILDEADFLNAQSTQPALRGAIEEFSNNCRFILTGNYENRIIDALKSRAPVVNFAFTKEEKKGLVVQFDKRIKQILTEQNVTYDKTELAQLVIKNFPDFRKTLNLLQRFCHSGHLNPSSMTGLDDDQLKQLVGFLREREFSNARKWVVEQMDNDGAMVRRALYDKMNDLIAPESIPQLILHLADYDYKESFVVDKEINMVALLVNLMADIKFK